MNLNNNMYVQEFGTKSVFTWTGQLSLENQYFIDLHLLVFLHILSDDSWFSLAHTTQGKDEQFQLDQVFCTCPYANASIEPNVDNQLCPSALGFLLGWSQRNYCLLQLSSDMNTHFLKKALW